MQPLLRFAAAGPLGLRMIVRPLLGSTSRTTSHDDRVTVAEKTSREALARRRLLSANELDRLEL